MNTPRIVRMENFRRVVQILTFLAFVCLFMLTIGKYDPDAKQTILKSAAPIDTFFRIDPLLGLTTMISVREIIRVMLLYALPIVVLTVLAGRFFCGWICPLGTALDATDALFFRGRKRKKPDTSRRNIKYYLLGAILAAAVFSAQIAYLFDPITIITRGMTFVSYPVLQLAANALSESGVGFPPLTDSAYIPRDVHYLFRLNFLAAVVLIGILAANFISRRFWCRNLCPLGALLALISKVSLVRRIVRSNCAKCAKCIPDCKMGAIPDDPLSYQAPECIYCYACTSVCPTLSTRIAPTLRSDGYNSRLDLSRRRIFQGVGMGALVALLGKTNAAAKTDRNNLHKVAGEFLIRPPGALPEEQFVDRCVRCTECMKVCPTGGLQPAITEAGFEGLWTPVLVPRIGECSQNCNLCSKVCSTQAIQPFEITEKPHIYIGEAFVDRSQCVAWYDDRQCLVCHEACSYRAIQMRVVDGVKRPFVDEHKCVGCGICENVCIIQPRAAIRVFANGDKHHRDRAAGRAFYDQGKQNSNQNKGIY